MEKFVHDVDQSLDSGHKVYKEIFYWHWLLPQLHFYEGSGGWSFPK